MAQLHHNGREEINTHTYTCTLWVPESHPQRFECSRFELKLGNLSFKNSILNVSVQKLDHIHLIFWNRWLKKKRKSQSSVLPLVKSVSIESKVSFHIYVTTEVWSSQALGEFSLVCTSSGSSFRLHGRTDRLKSKIYIWNNMKNNTDLFSIA